MNTRKQTNVYLIGQPQQDISGCELPTKRQILQHYFFNYQVLKKNKNESVKCSIEKIIPFWKKKISA